MNPDTLISIIVPCYNQAHFLGATLSSVYEQSYPHWECIIVNDGSPDNTEEVAQTWVQKDSRFVYLKKINGGLSSARNAGIAIAKGDFLIFLDSDDQVHCDKIKLSLSMAKEEKAAVVVTNFLRFKKDLNTLRPAHCQLTKDLLTHESIMLNWDTVFTFPPHAVMASRDLFDDIKFNESLKAKEDWYMWIQLFNKNPKVSFLDKNLSYYRKNPKGMTRDFTHMRNNLDKSYETIYHGLSDENKILFFNKLIKDSSNDILYYRKKFLKYKKLSKMAIMGLIGFLICSVILLFLLVFR